MNTKTTLLLLALTAILSCKKSSNGPDTNIQSIPDTTNQYTGISKTYDQLGYKHFGRISSENAYKRTYSLECQDMQLVNGLPEMICLQFWYGNAAATIGVYGRFNSDSFEKDANYHGCNTVFLSSNPLYTYSYKISENGSAYNPFTRSSMPFNINYDQFICDNKGTALSKGLYSIAKPAVLCIQNEYYVYHLVNEVIGKGFPLIISKLNKASGDWETVDTIDYINSTNTCIDAITSNNGTQYVCINPMPTNSTIGKVRMYKNEGSDWVSFESSKVFGIADSILALGFTKANPIRLIPNDDNPYIAILNDNSLHPNILVFSFNGSQINLMTNQACNLSDGIAPSTLSFVYYDNQILTYGISKSIDYSRTIYKVTSSSGFVPYKSIPIQINRKINYLKVMNGQLYIAMKEIIGPEFFPEADRHNEFIDLIKLK
jgi:hypothetical protein